MSAEFAFGSAPSLQERLAHDLSVAAIVLFGSRAREDHSDTSDTDILCIVKEGEPRRRTVGHVTMFFYAWQKLLDDAEAGDLFVGHVALEAKGLHDPQGCLRVLRDRFRLRSSYSRENEWAADVGWFLQHHAEHLDPDLACRRMVWCVRTILISRSAEAGSLVFAPRALEAWARSDGALEILRHRRCGTRDGSLMASFGDFLQQETMPDSVRLRGSLAEFQERFIRTGNQIGLRTFQKADDDREEY